MDCKPISVNTSFKVKPRSTKNYDPFKLYRIQYEATDKLRRKIIEDNGLHDYANGFSSIIDGIMSFIDGLVNIFKSFGPEPNYPKIKQNKIPRSKFSGTSAQQRNTEAMKRDYDAIANAWEKVGDTLSFIMGGK